MSTNRPLKQHMHPNNSFGNSETPEQGLRRFGDRIHLGQILSAHKLPPEAPNDKLLSRQARASVKCCEHVLGTNPRDNVSFITITTRVCDARHANAELSKIVEKVIKPQSIDSVRFFHRTLSGCVHWHLLVSHPWVVFKPGGADAYGHNRAVEDTSFSLPNHLRVTLAEILTPEAKSLVAKIRHAMRSHQLGYRAWIEPIIREDAVSWYLARYIAGSARYGRYRHDKGIRLWAASRSARVCNARFQSLSCWSRNRRLKSAAYCNTKGWYTMEEACEADPRWHYHARPILEGMKLRTYLFEADFVADWGPWWSPETRGVRILHPGKCPPEQIGPFKPFTYFYAQGGLTAELRAALAEELAQAFELPPGVWKGSAES